MAEMWLILRWGGRLDISIIYAKFPEHNSTSSTSTCIQLYRRRTWLFKNCKILIDILWWFTSHDLTRNHRTLTQTSPEMASITAADYATQLPLPRVTIQFCTQCKWMLRSVTSEHSRNMIHSPWLLQPSTFVTDQTNLGLLMYVIEPNHITSMLDREQLYPLTNN